MLSTQSLLSYLFKIFTGRITLNVITNHSFAYRKDKINTTVTFLETETPMDTQVSMAH